MSRKLTFDTWLFSTAMLMLVVGLVMIYSASAMIATQRFGHGPYYFLMRQLAFLVVGGAAMLFLMHLNPAMLENRRVVYGALAVVALGLIVALFQSPINGTHRRSEEHTSELQSRLHLVCRLLLEKKKKRIR